MTPLGELLNESDRQCPSVKIPLYIPYPVRGYAVITAFLTFNIRPKIPFISVGNYEMSKLAKLGSFSFWEMFQIMPRTVKQKHHDRKSSSVKSKLNTMLLN